MGAVQPGGPRMAALVPWAQLPAARHLPLSVDEALVAVPALLLARWLGNGLLFRASLVPSEEIFSTPVGGEDAEAAQGRSKDSATKGYASLAQFPKRHLHVRPPGPPREHPQLQDEGPLTCWVMVTWGQGWTEDLRAAKLPGDQMWAVPQGQAAVGPAWHRKGRLLSGWHSAPQALGAQPSPLVGLGLAVGLVGKDPVLPEGAGKARDSGNPWMGLVVMLPDCLQLPGPVCP